MLCHVCRAMSRNTCFDAAPTPGAPGTSGRMTSGTPRSPPVLTCISSGTRPSTGTSTRFASASKLSGEPNNGYCVPVSGATKCDMLSTRPKICQQRRTGTLTLWNMVMPLRASASATSCGVLTTTAPSTVTSWQRLSATSPVPGGISTTSTSSGAP